MRAVVMTRYGGMEVVEERDMPRPAPQKDEVLIEVFSASLNPVDIKIRNGKFKVLHAYRLPHIMGCDVAGIVAEVGPGVSRFKPGDKVYAFTGAMILGAFAEYVALPESSVALQPSNVSHDEAASLPLVSLTVYHALTGIAGVKAGQRVFIRSGSGGSGVVGIQYAKSLGAEVITTASTGNVSWVQALGADRVIDYKTEDFEKTVQDCDVVLETLEGSSMMRSFNVIKRGGRFISIGDMPDAKFAKDFGLNPIMQFAFGLVSRKATQLAKTRGCQYDFFLVRPNGDRLVEIARLVEEKRIKPVIDRVFPMDQAAAALAHQESGRAQGKIVLQIKTTTA